MATQLFWATHLPAINACFNAASATLLALGYIAIRRHQVGLHLRLMLAALTSSTLFLVGYLTRMALTGTHRFPGTGTLKLVYLTLLFSHMVLAVVLLPLVLRTLYLAYQRRFDVHRRWARVTWPIWMYVSVTGVVVYYMLYHVAPTLETLAG
jgi:putative membrane protein